MHIKPGDEAIARVLGGAFEESATDALAAVPWQNGEPKFCEIVADGHVRHPDERETIVVDGKHRVAVEIDIVHVGRKTLVGGSCTEPQTSVLRWQREKVLRERRSRACGETLDDDGHEHASISN